LHAYVAQKFSNDTGSTLNLVARARQFSSFILMVGRIASATVFEPKGAIIIQNKDDLKIPLMLEALPTPKEFKDAIVSMSPEQQAFCKAYRAMQLESTLFGVVVLQIKPQLEKLLRLPDDSLTKEIRLTQDLFELFQKYQIPSDLLSYDGKDNVSVEDKLTRVKGYVEKLQQMIKQSKKTEIKQLAEEALYVEPLPIIEPDYPIAVDDYMVYSESSAPSFDLMADINYSSAPMMKMQKSSAPVFESLSMAPSIPAPARKSVASASPARNKSAASPVMKKQATPASTSTITPKPAKPTTPTSTTTGSAPPAKTDAPPKQHGTAEPAGVDEGEDGELVELLDYTKIPGELDRKFESLDEDSALRPTIINIGETWTKVSYPSLLAGATTASLDADGQKQENNKAYDLIDALSRSGSLSFEHAELHVVIAATHCFDKSLMDTVIIDNVNPIEKLERSSLIIASTIQAREPQDLIKGEHVERVKKASPKLFGVTDSLPALPAIPHGLSSAALKLFATTTGSSSKK
jgi:hypothetical protein